MRLRCWAKRSKDSVLEEKEACWRGNGGKSLRATTSYPTNFRTATRMQRDTRLPRMYSNSIHEAALQSKKAFKKIRKINAGRKRNAGMSAIEMR